MIFQRSALVSGRNNALYCIWPKTGFKRLFPIELFVLHRLGIFLLSEDRLDFWRLRSIVDAVYCFYLAMPSISSNKKSAFVFAAGVSDFFYRYIIPYSYKKASIYLSKISIFFHFFQSSSKTNRFYRGKQVVYSLNIKLNRFYLKTNW